MITVDQLTACTGAKPVVACLWFKPLTAAMDRFEINTTARVAAFLAQIAHESARLSCVEENLNYSAEGLCKTWRKRFPSLEFAKQYARQPQKIANFVYANRGGNGDESSGDGWRHRGAGLIQLTFKNNQSAAAAHFRIDVDQVGDWLRTIEGAGLSAAWFWQTHGCNELADEGDFDGVSDAINIGRLTEAEGDAIGFADRLALFNHALQVLS